ncbi:MAG: thiamine phosphate synthase [Acidobacteria bacterium]|nr:thiamine phosphate synthase [Acidobacteriota bacterium]MCA1638035.1 thiamine phosphate synthase [Acidobacteriota bacterium]
MDKQQGFFDKFLIYLITEGETTPQNFPEKSEQILNLVRIAAENKISLIQIREKQLPARLVFKLVSKAVKITQNTKTKILVNDRADVAHAANANGVHLTSASLSARTIRQNFPREFIIGVSTHTIEKAETAKREGADFITFSPIFTTPGKSPPKGLDALREVCEKLKSFPVVALGGINETNFKSVLDAGANGFAAIRFLNDSENLPKIMFNLTQRWNDAKENK